MIFNATSIISIMPINGEYLYGSSVSINAALPITQPREDRGTDRIVTVAPTTLEVDRVRLIVGTNSTHPTVTYHELVR